MGKIKTWIIDVESFTIKAETEDEAEKKAKEYLLTKPLLLIENVTMDEDGFEIEEYIKTCVTCKHVNKLMTEEPCTTCAYTFEKWEKQELK